MTITAAATRDEINEGPGNTLLGAYTETNHNAVAPFSFIPRNEWVEAAKNQMALMEILNGASTA